MIVNCLLMQLIKLRKFSGNESVETRCQQAKFNSLLYSESQCCLEVLSVSRFTDKLDADSKLVQTSDLKKCELYFF